MWTLLPLLLVPFGIMLAAKVFFESEYQRFTVKEFLFLEALMSVMIVTGFFVAREAAMADTETHTGRITTKSSGVSGCCHCYTVCTSRSRKGACTSSRRVCPHAVDHWWSLGVSTGDTLSIASCQSLPIAPAAWTNARVGEPAAVSRFFRNYLLADPESVLLQAADPEEHSPDYPRIHDFYRVDRAIGGGTRMDEKAWSQLLDEANADLGELLKVNIVVVATTEAEPKLVKALERDWVYGKPNEAIFVLGAPDGETITWADVVTVPTGNSDLKIAANELVGLKLSTTAPIPEIRRLVSAHWAWTGIEKFAYLSWAAQPSWVSLIILYLIGIALAVFGSAVMLTTDVFNDE